MAKDVWITGIGLVSNLGEGLDAHWHALVETERPAPVIDSTTYDPFSVFPLVDIDFDQQIPKRGDQRQMEPWQRVGTYTAGLALTDAGLAGDLETLGDTDMIIAAGGGERDTEVDAQILEGLPEKDRQPYINEHLVNDLRPTLFLAQLPNLLAGNISIVHKVTGSSRSFMGEESAGITAIDTARRRIAAGQSRRALVGGAYVATRKDLFLNHACGRLNWAGEPMSVWARPDKGGGFIIGSVAAFLVLEARDQAEARGARAYARLGGIESDWSRREPGKAAADAARELAALKNELDDKPTALLTSATGNAISAEERDFLAGLRDAGTIAAIRATANYFGSAYEADFPASVALAALALFRKGLYRSADDSGFERAVAMVPERMLVNCWSHWRGTGMAALAAIEEG